MDLENRLFEVEKCNMSIHEIAVTASKSKERMNGGQPTCSKHTVELAQREDNAILQLFHLRLIQRERASEPIS